MGGVGGFLKENRTLYVGRIAVTDDVDEVIKRQFGQFGPLERGTRKCAENLCNRKLTDIIIVRILKGRGVAFVTYKTRANAEFAREAMMNQSLENNEIINVRWATSDPNAIANRLDAEDDRRRAAEEAAREEEELIIEFEEEPELPPEPEKKRNVAQAGLQESDSVAKKQKEDEVNGYDYTEEDIENYYDYYNSEQQEQQQYLEQQYQYQYQEEPVKEEGIIPKKVLDNLKTLTKNSPTTITAKTTTNDSLGGLADYGSSDEE